MEIISNTNIRCEWVLTQVQYYIIYIFIYYLYIKDLKEEYVIVVNVSVRRASTEQTVGVPSAKNHALPIMG